MAVNQPRFLPPKAAYIHVPFCRHRCGYCNFTVAARREDLIESYLQAIQTELAWLDQPEPIRSLYVGGGTPSHLTPDQLHRFLNILGDAFEIHDNCEFSFEANPMDINAERVDQLVEAGVNRVSLGVQSILDRKLTFLQRDHRRAEAERACELLRRRIPDINVDLIFGAPKESMAEWQADLLWTLAQDPVHVSVYGLTIERGSPFYGQYLRGEWETLDDVLERELFEFAIDTLTAARLEHYEVSNFARAGHRCRHNEVYWTGNTYYAVGPGAARFVDGVRETNHRSVTTYLKRVHAGASPVAERERLAPDDAAREHLVFALRRMEGIDRTAFAQQTGFTVAELVGTELAPLVSEGLLEEDAHQLRLTRAGLMVSDAIWPALLRR